MHFDPAVWMDFQRASPWWSMLRDVFGAPWFQNLVLVVTAGIGLWTLGASSRQERRRATVDVLLDVLDDKDFLEARRAVRALIDKGLDIPHLLSSGGLEDRRKVLSILTRYEFMAAGLCERAFDTKIYKRMYYSTVIIDWNDLEAFVLALREDRRTDTLFQEVERLVIRWKKHPLKAYYKLRTKVSRTVSLTVTAPATPTFTLSVSPASASVAQGGEGTSAITTVAGSGFDSAVALTASGQPAGVTVRFSPASVAAGSGTSKMTMAVAAKTVPGTYSITVTGARGGLLRRLWLRLFRPLKAMLSRRRREGGGG